VTGRSALIDFFQKDFLTMVDESHVSIPQIGGMYNGDLARKRTLVNFGFPAASALDNRAQSFGGKFEQITARRSYVSATPAKSSWSVHVVAEQVIRHGPARPLITRGRRRAR